MFAILVLLYYTNKYFFSLPTVLLIIIEGYIAVDTYINQGNTSYCFKMLFTIIGIAMIYEHFSVDYEDFVNAELIAYEILIYINLISILMFPNGLYKTISNKNWFLGYYNSHIQYFLPALIFALLYNGKKAVIRRMVLISAMFISSFLTWSGGSIATLFVIVFCYLFTINKTSIFNYYSYWMIQPAFFALVILNGKIGYLKWIVGEVLGKWHSFNNRIRIWNIELKHIPDFYLFGKGIEYSPVRVRVYFKMPWAVHAHNFILEALHQGGIIYLFLLSILILYTGRKILTVNYDRRIKVISLAFLGWAVRGTVDPCLHVAWAAFFILACSVANQIKLDTSFEYNCKAIVGNGGKDGKSDILCQTNVS